VKQREGLMAKVLQVVSGSTADRIAAERDAIGGIERLIVELEQQQQSHLTDIDPSRALQNEAAIDANRRALGVRRARLAALQEQARREDLDRREQQRAAGIDGNVAPKLKKCEALVGDLMKALAAVDAARAALREVGDSVSRDWPAAVPKVPYFHFSLTTVEDRLQKAFRVAGDRLHSTSRLAEIVNTNGNWETSPLVAEMERRVANYLDDLRQVPNELDDDAAAAA
jgi:hypothetical protein